MLPNEILHKNLWLCLCVTSNNVENVYNKMSVNGEGLDINMSIWLP